MKQKTVSILLLVAIVVFSCTYKKEAIEYPTASITSCDTSNVRYSVEISSIISNNCLSCHATAVANSLGSGNRLDSYNNIKPYASSGLLLGVVMHASGFSPMPKNASKLSNCDIAKIRTWIRIGTPNN